MDSICTVTVAGQRFGVETGALLQVIRPRGMRRVPLAPAFVCGVLPYRGEVLTVVAMRSLLQDAAPAAAGDEDGCVLVMEAEGEPFGLLVDEVGAVLDGAELEAMPAAVGERMRWLFGGVLRLEGELVAWMEPGRLRPGRLVSWKQGRTETGGMA